MHVETCGAEAICMHSVPMYDLISICYQRTTNSSKGH